MRQVHFSLLAVMTLIFVSCGNENNLHSVTGTVTYKGQPATGATVCFLRQGADNMKEQMIMGIVQSDGTFELFCGSFGKGAPPGEYDVTIEWKAEFDQSKEDQKFPADKLNGRYSDRSKPLLHATIKEESTKLPPFELTDK
jgi:hypothetical protein